MCVAERSISGKGPGNLFAQTRNPIVTYDPKDEGTTNPNLPPHLDVNLSENLSHFIKTAQQPRLCFQRIKYLLKTFLEGLPG